MKKIFYLISVIASLSITFAACSYTEFYVEGYIKTADAKNITQTSALCGGEVAIEQKGKDVSDIAVAVRGIVYGTDSLRLYSVTLDGNKGGNSSVQDTRNGEGTFSCQLENLTPYTKYYVRAFAQIDRAYVSKKGTKDKEPDVITEDSETHYGEIKSFRTVPGEISALAIQTQQVANLRSTSLDVVVELTSLGSTGLVSEVGVCLSSTTATPSITDNEFKVNDGSKTAPGIFNLPCTGLQRSTKYYIRAYAITSEETSYGAVLEATTPATTIEVPSGMVAYYTFDNDNCNESQGKSEYNGTKQGTGDPSFVNDIPGSAGKSLQLNNDAYYYVATSPFASNLTEYSASVWLKTMNNDNVVFMHQPRTGGSPGIKIQDNKIWCVQSDNTAFAEEGNFSSNSNFDVAINSLLLDGGWHLVTVTRKSGVFKLYIDGIYYANKNYSSTLSANVPLNIGRRFTGKMDNLRVYNRELTQSEITELYIAKQ
ncbi:MAG: LamG domain-containing protein [Prevotellaceae bacterium]|jgi:hypothetical protein|nr:LamG domain-containing protein [Prevotellaceae bacterium]